MGPRRSPLGARLAPAITLLGLSALPASAHAGDGVYGRLDGDLDLSLGAGAALTADAPAFVARFSAIYTATAGAYLGYADAFTQPEARVDRSLAAGISLKPLFWARFARDWQTGHPRLDLSLDSFLLDLGAYWPAPHAHSFNDTPGLELATGLGFPLFENATGPFLELRAALRLRPADLARPSERTIAEQGALLSLTLAWHHILPVHIADAGDRVLR